MALTLESYLAVAVILASIGVALSGRFLAVGALVLGNVGVFALQIVAQARHGVVACAEGGKVIATDAVQCELGLHATAVHGLEPIGGLQLLTSMFVHGDFLHIGMNVLILLAFALPFEERIGHRPFTFLYLGTGLVAGLGQLGTQWGDPMLLIGASGAVFGIIGAFAGAYPDLKVRLPIIAIVILFVNVRVWIAAAVAAAMQMLYFSIAPPLDNTAYAAHLAGLLAGIVFGFVYARTRKGKRQASPQGPIPPERLEPFAGDKRAREALDHIRAERDHPEIVQAWSERFWRRAECPECGNRVQPVRPGRLLCKEGHGWDLRKDPVERSDALDE